MTENMKSGWFAVKRGMLDHPIFHKRHDRVYVWMWMLEKAAYQATRQDAGGRPVTVQRGQLLTSFRQIEAATGVSIKVIRGLIEGLKSERAIDTDTGTGRMLVTICNYDKYQAAGESKGTAKGTQRAQQGHTKETREQINNTPIAPKGADEFQEFWEAYPHRHGAKKNRKGAEAKYLSAVKKGASHSDIMEGVRAMVRFPDVQRGFARDPSAWLHQQGWTDVPPTSLSVINGGAGSGRPNVKPRAPGISPEFEMVLRGYGM
jgi:hypothetical protein